MENVKLTAEWIDLAIEKPKVHSENYFVYKNGIISMSIFRGDWNMFHCDINKSTNESFVTHWSESSNNKSL